MPETYSPSVRVRRISRALRGWREAHGAQSGAVAKRAGWSAAKQSRLETGGQAISPSDVMTLALLYEVSEEERKQVFNAALAAQEKGWWEELAKGALTDDVYDYVELESEAAELKTFKIDLVHGLFQTEAYVEALLRAFRPAPAEEIIRQQIRARVQRQARLIGARPIKVEMVLTEGALRVEVGGPAVMRGQLARLLELADLAHVGIRVLPAAAGAYPAMGLGFNILSFAGDTAEVGYVEVLNRGLYLEEPQDVGPYKVGFEAMRELALDEEESARLIAEVMAAMK